MIFLLTPQCASPLLTHVNGTSAWTVPLPLGLRKMSSWQPQRSQLGSNGVFTLPDTDTGTDYYWTHCWLCRCLEVWTHHNIGDILAAKMCLLYFSRTLTAVHDNILEDLCFPAEIVGKRTRVKLDGSKLIKIHLDKTQQTTVEHKVHVIVHTHDTHTHQPKRYFCKLVWKLSVY